MDKVRIGVAGLNRGRTLIEKARHCAGVEITAVCDIDRIKADKVAAEYNIGRDNTFYSLDDMLGCGCIDAVILATPIDLHADQVLKTLEAGRHVLSEVIAATTIDDCDAIVKSVRAHSPGLKYMMAENYCYIRPLTIVKNMAAAGLFGNIYYAESDYLKDFQVYNPKFPHLGGWREKTYFGRRGHPYITHSIGPIMGIIGGKITEVACMAAGHSFDMAADNTCVLMCRTDKGSMVRLRNSFVSPRPDNVTYYCIQGTEGCYQAPQGPRDFHKVHIRGLCKPDEWKNVYDFREYLPGEWKRLEQSGAVSAISYKNSISNINTIGNMDAISSAPGNNYDNDTYALYDSGTSLMLDAFASSIINDTEPPIGVADAANWTAAGIMSEVSVNNSSVPVKVPKF